MIADSYSQGSFLDDPGRSWPAHLAAALLHKMHPRLVVVEGGLNDVDSDNDAIRAGVRDLVERLRGVRVVIVGPPAAPAAVEAGRVDRALGSAAHELGVQYVQTYGWSLPYGPDQLHLTPQGHRLFGRRVAAATAAP